jgi:hypothetical protein
MRAAASAAAAAAAAHAANQMHDGGVNSTDTTDYIQYSKCGSKILVGSVVFSQSRVAPLESTHKSENVSLTTGFQQSSNSKTKKMSHRLQHMPCVIFTVLPLVLYL